jgi:hypothetical protein
MTVTADFGGRDYRTMEDPDYGNPRAAARANSQPKLVMTETLDDAGRKHRTFAYDTPGAFKTWMLPFMAEPQRMAYLNKDALPRDKAEAKAKRILADERATAQQIREHGIESIRADIGA